MAHAAAAGVTFFDLADPIIIVAVTAGYNVAKERANRQGRRLSSYRRRRRVHSAHDPALTKRQAPAAIPLNSAEQMAQQLGAVVRVRTRVTAIDAPAHQLRTGGESATYSKLVLASGAQQIRVPIAGDAADAVMTVNSLDDYARFRAALEGRKRVAVIGAGLMLRVRHDLAASGQEVEVDIAAQLLPRLPPAGGALLREKLAVLGVVWHFGTGVTKVTATPTRIA
jgi:rubredoxin-NAD+ reductase